MRRITFPLIVWCFVMFGKAWSADSTPEDLLQNHHLKRLRAWAEPRIAANPKDAQASYYLASVKEEFGDLDGALPVAEQLVSADPSNARYHLLVADICVAQAQKVGVFKGMSLAHRFRDEATKAASLDPNYIEAREDLMQYFFDAPGIAGGDKKRAWALADEIGKIDAVRGLLAQAALAGKEKNYGKQDGLFQQALGAAPHDPRALREAAEFYSSDSQKKYDRAEKFALEDIKLHDDQNASYIVLAVIYANSERWKDLDAIIAESETNVPNDYAAHYQSAKALIASGKDLPRAERYLRKYLTVEAEPGEPPWAGAHWRLGQVLEKEGKKTEAIAEMKAALRLQPDLKPAKDDLSRLQK